MSVVLNMSKGIAIVQNESLEKQITARLNNLTKPIGSLGRLEECALRFCLCRGSDSAKISAMHIFTFAGDHGITQEKIAPFPREVTTQMVLNMCDGGAAISVMSRNAGIKYSVVDMGVDADFNDHPCLIKCKIARGTKNFLNEAAMSISECEAALKAGSELFNGNPCDLVGVGEMGIGNSSSASALYSLILDKSADTTVGAGTGAAGDLLLHKKKIISEAVALHRRAWDGSGFDALRRVGGFEIAGMTGMILGAALRRIPVVIDGFISSAAALCAFSIEPKTKDYCMFAHASAEKFHVEYLEHSGIKPLLSLGMRLGEGTGAALAMQIVAQAMNCYHQMATFTSAGVATSEF